MFKLPSEKAFLLGGFDYNDLFGERKGINHSPHIRQQMDMDTNLVYLFGFMTIGLLLWENTRTHNFVTLRENMLKSDMGKFKEEDFN